MKELTIQQKAEAYDKVFARAKRMFSEKELNYLFSELAESEDERIRRAIIDIINNGYSEYAKEFTHQDLTTWLKKQGEDKPVISDDALREGIAHFGITQYQIDNWLKKYVDVEKQVEQKQDPCEHCNDRCLNCHNFPCIEKRAFEQGKSVFEISNEISNENPITNQFTNEQKPANKIEPKFKVGDWITFYGGEPFKILKVEPEQNGILDYLLLSQNGRDSYYNKNYVDTNARLWTIQDAKDGDVISYDDGWTCIFKNIHGIWYSSYCFITADGEFHTGYEEHAVDSTINGNAHPATKEQRDTLEKAMTEAEYEWNAEKKESKKIEQKSTWSEDEGMIQALNAYIDVAIKSGMNYISFDSKSILIGKVKTWLKSLKDRINWKPSDEQMHAFEQVYDWYNNNFAESETLTSLYQDLKKLKE